MKAAVVAPIILSLSLAALPQQPSSAEIPETTIRVDVDLVNLYFSVRDKKGAYIKDLSKHDIEVFEDGQPQTIRQFLRETDQPLTIGLLVDVSGSQSNLIEIERQAASLFFDHVLREKDLAFLMSFGSQAELLQDLTSSKTALKRALGELRLSASVGGVLLPPPVPTAPRRGTILYDAIYLAAEEILKHQVGRKMMVVISDGVDIGSRIKIEEAVAAAHKADSIIYSIYYADPSAYGPFGGRGDGDLRRISEETGGRLFKVGRKYTLQDVFRDIEEEVRSQYVVVYSPSNTARDGSFRRVEIKPANRNYRIQARKGYYAPGPDGR
jgi:VWFA-related protein